MEACVSGSALAQMVPNFSSSASSSGGMREEPTLCLYSAPKGPDSSRKTTCSRVCYLISILTPQEAVDGLGYCSAIRSVCVTTERGRYSCSLRLHHDQSWTHKLMILCLPEVMLPTSDARKAAGSPLCT